MEPITTTEGLAEACRILAEAPFVTVDTEFIRETTFSPELCLIQMASDTLAVIVDPLAPGIDLAPFFALMKDERVIKVFHAARQDLEIGALHRHERALVVVLVAQVQLLLGERPAAPVGEARGLVDAAVAGARDELVIGDRFAEAADHRGDLGVEQRLRQEAAELVDDLKILPRGVEHLDHALVAH